MERSIKWTLVFIIFLLILTPTITYVAGPHPQELRTIIADNAGSYISQGVPFYSESITSAGNMEYVYIQLNGSVKCISDGFPAEFEIRIIGTSENGQQVLFLSIDVTSINYQGKGVQVSFINENNYNGTELIYYYEITTPDWNITSLSNLYLNGTICVYSQFGPFFELQKTIPIN